jgi:hypothetical protein
VDDDGEAKKKSQVPANPTKIAEKDSGVFSPAMLQKLSIGDWTYGVGKKVRRMMS